MNKALLLLLCSTVLHVGVSQTLPTVLPRTETVAPPIQRCSLDDQAAFIATLPKAQECGASLITVFGPTANNTVALRKALVNLCTDDCGGTYASFLESTCNDKVSAETIRLYCTPTNGSADAGPYCSFTIGSFTNQSLFNNLYSCNETDICSPMCRTALTNIKAQVGCCYQNAYNNSRYNEQLLNAGFITPSDFEALQKLNDPVGNPWTLCDITPPQRCGPPSIRPPPPPRCTLDDQVAYISSLPNAAVCGQNLVTVFSPPANDSMALPRALENVCTNDCGGVYSNFLTSTCNDRFGAESLRIYCTPTNGSATVGNYCRFAVGDILDQSLLDNLDLCNETSCTAGCMAALLKLKRQTGCCYQNVYNNTVYNRELLHSGFITPSEFTHIQQLNDPYFSPWTSCGIEPPRSCGPPVFRPPAKGCPRGTYRRNRTCEQCPANTNITLSGGNATVCPCREGFFRANQEDPSERCSAPPSACRNIQATQQTATQITLRWRKPINTGRHDFYYQIKYSDGESTGQHSMESDMDYIQESITGLKPNTGYRFTVTVNNGVSDQDTRDERLRSCELMARTMEGRPSPPRDVQGFCSAVAWRMPRSPNGRITGYDVRLDRVGAIMSVGSDGTFLAVEKEFQQRGISFQVRAKTRVGVGNWSEQIQLGCEDSPIGTCPPCECPTTSQPPPDIHFALGGQVYRNNSVVPLSRIGEGDSGALFCRTDNTNCCGTIPNRFGQFYYPSGTQVPVSSAGQGFYRNRGDQLIRLNRRDRATSPTGRYRCEIPDANGVMKSIYITLV